MQYFLAAAACLFLAGCASLTEHRIGRDASGDLYPCPQAPRCVSSQHPDPERRVLPFVLRDSNPQTWTAAVKVLATQPRTSVVVFEPTYVRAEVISPWRFYTDDVEWLLKEDGVTVDVRSTGRIGYYDFDVNLDRVSALREQLRQADLLGDQ